MVWNMLPFEVKSSLTVKDFKINLEHFNILDEYGKCWKRK